MGVGLLLLGERRVKTERREHKKVIAQHAFKFSWGGSGTERVWIINEGFFLFFHFFIVVENESARAKVLTHSSLSNASPDM
ncbi:hypothetical protein K457DRAFT_135773 [Linnemannia elongata AG-77]|uniref:Uncharacterized protein n=1 Tax=Linnemannia elongata AG-77 TaxID=1314771 RepID=A0A197K322_9FUNG|nr:hypothetical protein K457DRAFT_135773 [Linnemannia elongata AG-77]